MTRPTGPQDGPHAAQRPGGAQGAATAVDGAGWALPDAGTQISIGRWDGSRVLAAVDPVRPDQHKLRYFTATLADGGRVFLLADWRDTAWRLS